MEFPVLGHCEPASARNHSHTSRTSQRLFTCRVTGVILKASISITQAPWVGSLQGYTDSCTTQATGLWRHLDMSETHCLLMLTVCQEAGRHLRPLLYPTHNPLASLASSLLELASCMPPGCWSLSPAPAWMVKVAS